MELLTLIAVSKEVGNEASLWHLELRIRGQVIKVVVRETDAPVRVWGTDDLELLVGRRGVTGVLRLLVELEKGRPVELPVKLPNFAYP